MRGNRYDFINLVTFGYDNSIGVSLCSQGRPSLLHYGDLRGLCVALSHFITNINYLLVPAYWLVLLRSTHRSLETHLRSEPHPMAVATTRVFRWVLKALVRIVSFLLPEKTKSDEVLRLHCLLVDCQCGILKFFGKYL